MKKQNGAALVVVLSMLTASLMLGLTSIQSSMIDERLAGNYRAASQAQMNAERAASNMWSRFDEYKSSPASDSADNNFGLEDRPGWSEFKNLAESSVSCLSLAEDTGLSGAYDGVACHLEISGLAGVDDGSYIVAMGAVGDGDVAVSEAVLVKVSMGGVISAVEAALSCVGKLCSFSPGSGNSGPAIDGTDRYEEGETQGSHKPNENPDGRSVAAIMMPDVSELKSEDGSRGSNNDVSKGGVVGQEIYSPEEYESYEYRANESWAEAQDRIFSDIENALALAKSNAEGFYYAGPGEQIAPGTSSGVVVIEGGVLNLGSNDKFSGLVVLTSGLDENGEVVYGSIYSSGTATIVGAVIGKDFSYGGKGNPSIFYSSEAIEEYVGGSAEGGGTLKIVSWY